MTAAVFGVPACMGGWCASRDQCARYHQVDDRADPAERLCSPGWRPMFLPLGDLNKHPLPLLTVAQRPQLSH